MIKQATSPPLDFDGANRRFRAALGLDKVCAACSGQSGDRDVRPRSSMTAYHWDGKGPDPNADILLCEPCAEHYFEMMNEMWNECRSGLM